MEENKTKIKKDLFRGARTLKSNSQNRGITLIALVITIVVLIILAGVLINISLGNNGLFNKAKTAKEMYTNAQNYEETEIAKMTNNMDSYVGGNRETVTIDKDEYEQLKNLSSYSSEDKVIGRYIDGDIIYRKTITGKTPSKNGSLYDATSLNIKKCTNIEGFVYNSNNKIQVPIIYSYGTTSYIGLYYDETSKTLQIRSLEGVGFNSDFVLTIEYTKTTD